MSCDRVIRAFFDKVWNEKNLQATGEIFEVDAVIHGSVSDFKGVKAIQEMFHSWLTAFPDLHYKVVEIISTEDRAACHFYGTGTHQAPFLGCNATGKNIEHKGIEIFHFSKNGKVKELWAFSNMLDIFKALSASH